MGTIVNTFIEYLLQDTKDRIVQWFPFYELSFDGEFDFENIFKDNPNLQAWHNSLFRTHLLNTTFFANVLDGYAFIQDKSVSHPFYALYIQPDPSCKIVLMANQLPSLGLLYKTALDLSPVMPNGDGLLPHDFIQTYIFSHGNVDSNDVS